MARGVRPQAPGLGGWPHWQHVARASACRSRGWGAGAAAMTAGCRVRVGWPRQLCTAGSQDGGQCAAGAAGDRVRRGSSELGRRRTATVAAHGDEQEAEEQPEDKDEMVVGLKNQIDSTCCTNLK